MDDRRTELDRVQDAGATGLSPWVEALRTACLTLCRTPSRDVRSISVTVQLEEAPGIARTALRMVRAIAEEYGLVGVAQVDGLHLTARFSRPDAPHAGPRVSS